MINKISVIIKDKWILILVIIWFLIGLGLLCSYSEWNWQVLTGIATWVLAGGVFFAFWQIMQARKSTNAHVAMDLFRELRSDKTLKILRFIYSLKPEDDRQNLHSINKHNIDCVLNRLCVLGALLDEGIINRSLAIEGFSGPAVLRCWYQLFDYIKHVQQKRGDYYENYEGFVRLCLDHFKKEGIKVKFENRYVNIENLVTEFDQDKERRPRSLAEIRRDRKDRIKEEAKEAKRTMKKDMSKLGTNSSA